MGREPCVARLSSKPCIRGIDDVDLASGFGWDEADGAVQQKARTATRRHAEVTDHLEAGSIYDEHSPLPRT